MGGRRDHDESPNEAAGDPTRFAGALERLGWRWFWWLILGSWTLTITAGGHRIGVSLLGWILGPLVLLALRDLRAAAPRAAARGFTVVLALATVAAALHIAVPAGTDGRPSPPLAAMGWTLVMLGLGLFSMAMAQWADATTVPELGATETWIPRRWRRSAAWCWAGLACSLAATAVAAGGLWVRGAHTAIRVEIGGDWSPALVALVVAAVVVLLGPVFSVAASTNRTLRMLEAPAALRQQGEPVGGG